MTETNKCGNCGAVVPAEKAFCPNCSEPMEPEEAPDRAAAMSSEMMSTIRDDPESYKELLERLKKDRAAAKQNPSGPVQATPQPPAPAAAPPVAPPASPAQGYNYPPAAPGYPAQNYPAPNYPAPPAKGGGRYVVLGIVAAVVLIIILLFAFKVIPL
ncbi:MAG TPA: zinc ribbon domain-containing protein [Pyrinomonadaceae bacterium]|nr:zinc ribbon domain-containing protein [Pyrinomonadaceae bacterium]